MFRTSIQCKQLCLLLLSVISAAASSQLFTTYYDKNERRSVSLPNPSTKLAEQTCDRTYELQGILWTQCSDIHAEEPGMCLCMASSKQISCPCNDQFIQCSIIQIPNSTNVKPVDEVQCANNVRCSLINGNCSDSSRIIGPRDLFFQNGLVVLSTDEGVFIQSQYIKYSCCPNTIFVAGSVWNKQVPSTNNTLMLFTGTTISGQTQTVDITADPSPIVMMPTVTLTVISRSFINSVREEFKFTAVYTTLDKSVVTFDFFYATNFNGNIALSITDDSYAVEHVQKAVNVRPGNYSLQVTTRLSKPSGTSKVTCTVAYSDNYIEQLMFTLYVADSCVEPTCAGVVCRDHLAYYYCRYTAFKLLVWLLIILAIVFLMWIVSVIIRWVWACKKSHRKNSLTSQKISNSTLIKDSFKRMWMFCPRLTFGNTAKRVDSKRLLEEANHAQEHFQEQSSTSSTLRRRTSSNVDSTKAGKVQKQVNDRTLEDSPAITEAEKQIMARLAANRRKLRGHRAIDNPVMTGTLLISCLFTVTFAQQMIVDDSLPAQCIAGDSYMYASYDTAITAANITGCQQMNHITKCTSSLNILQFVPAKTGVGFTERLVNRGETFRATDIEVSFVFTRVMDVYNTVYQYSAVDLHWQSEISSRCPGTGTHYDQYCMNGMEDKLPNIFSGPVASCPGFLTYDERRACGSPMWCIAGCSNNAQQCAKTVPLITGDTSEIDSAIHFHSIEWLHRVASFTVVIKYGTTDTRQNLTFCGKAIIGQEFNKVYYVNETAITVNIPGALEFTPYTTDKLIALRTSHAGSIVLEAKECDASHTYEADVGTPFSCRMRDFSVTPSRCALPSVRIPDGLWKIDHFAAKAAYYSYASCQTDFYGDSNVCLPADNQTSGYGQMLLKSNSINHDDKLRMQADFSIIVHSSTQVLVQLTVPQVSFEKVYAKPCPIVTNSNNLTDICYNCNMKFSICFTVRSSCETGLTQITVDDPLVTLVDVPSIVAYNNVSRRYCVGAITRQKENVITLEFDGQVPYYVHLNFTANLTAGIVIDNRTVDKTNDTAGGDYSLDASGYWHSMDKAFGSVSRWFRKTFGKIFGAILQIIVMFILPIVILILLAYLIYRVISNRLVKKSQSQRSARRLKRRELQDLLKDSDDESTLGH